MSQRSSSKKRGAGMPLPAPRDHHTDVRTDVRTPTRRGGRPPTFGDVTSDLPRLPESQLIDESVGVVVDEPYFDANQSALGEARSRPVPAEPAAKRRPPKEIDLRNNTAQHQQIIGGRYRILHRIGQGGMGKVYKVAHIKLSRTFALKIISDSVSESREARALFDREARFASAMQHPGITQVVDFGEDEGVGLFMVMELVEGEALHRILFRHKQLSVRYACEVVLQLADALHYIHQKGVAHCDIKTENILVHESDDPGKRRALSVKLLDFGLARPLNPGRNKQTLSGTPHYVAPERIRGEPATPASDVYSLGILLYELLTGRVPWDGAVPHILSGHLDEQPIPPSHFIAGGLDNALEALILRALAKNPADRHRNMTAFVYELKTVLEMAGHGRRKTPPKRVGKPAASERDQLGRAAFDACRLPLALLDHNAVITVANLAFSKFVAGVVADMDGTAIATTALASAWATYLNDIARTLAGDPVRRIIEIDVGGGEVRRLLLWLDGESEHRVLLGVQPLEL